MSLGAILGMWLKGLLEMAIDVAATTTAQNHVPQVSKLLRSCVPSGPPVGDDDMEGEGGPRAAHAKFDINEPMLYCLPVSFEENMRHAIDVFLTDIVD